MYKFLPKKDKKSPKAFKSKVKNIILLKGEFKKEDFIKLFIAIDLYIIVSFLSALNP